MKFTTPNKINVEFTDEEKNAIETTLGIMNALLEKMKKAKYTCFSTDDFVLSQGDIGLTRNFLNIFFEGNKFYLE